MYIPLWLALLVLAIVCSVSIWLVSVLVKRIIALETEGVRLQQAAQDNDAALRQGLEDQAEAYEQEFLSKNEYIYQLTQELELSRSTLTRFITRLNDLEVEHAFHDAHCLPVLEHMRAEIDG